MKDRFVFAILASFAVHLLLIEMVIALEILWPPARQAVKRHVIPVTLLEVASLANPSRPAPLDRAKPAKNVRPGLTDPHQELARLKVSPGGKAGPAKASPPPVVDPNCAAPTARPLLEAENQQEVEAAPVVAIAATPADTRSPSCLTSSADTELCMMAVGPGDAISGAVRAEGRTSGGGEAGYGGQGDEKTGGGALLIPGEFLAGNTPPRYPLIAQRKGWEGTVVIDIRVSGGGRVQEARIDKSSGYTVLDHAALGAVRNWRIALPGRLADSSFKFRVPVVFKLTPS